MVFNGKERFEMDEKLKVNANVYYAKGLFKTGLSLGAGLVVGKTIGELISPMINGAIMGIIKGFAKHGNKAAQKALDKTGVKYEKTFEEELRNIGNDPRQ